MAASEKPSASRITARGCGQPWQGQLLPLAVAAVATLAVHLGLYAAARAGGVDQRSAVLATLAAATLTAVLAGPLLAATGRTGISSVLRGAVVADVSGVTAVMLWLLTPYVGFVAAAKIYCTFAALAVFSIAAATCPSAPQWRCVAAVATTLCLLGALASPFWIGGPLKAADADTAGTIVAAAVYANPFYSITSAVADRTRFVWHQGPIMYGMTRIGDYALPPPVPWYAASLTYGPLAAVLAASHLLRPRRYPA